MKLAPDLIKFCDWYETSNYKVVIFLYCYSSYKLLDPTCIPQTIESSAHEYIGAPSTLVATVV